MFKSDLEDDGFYRLPYMAPRVAAAALYAISILPRLLSGMLFSSPCNCDGYA